MGRRNPLTDWAQFLVKDIHDVITHATFGDDRLRGSGVVAGQISAFPIDFASSLQHSNTTVWACGARGGTENAGAQYAGLEMWELISGLENARPEFVGPNVGVGIYSTEKWRTGICGTKCQDWKIQDRKMRGWKMKDHGYYSGNVVNIFTRCVWHAAHYVNKCGPLFCWFPILIFVLFSMDTHFYTLR